MDPIRTFKRGQIIFREGEAPGNVYFVIEGKVRLVKNFDSDPTVIDYIGRNGVFGEMAMFDKHPRSATAVAEEFTKCYVMDQVEFQRRLDKIDPFILGIIRVMSERLRSTTTSFASTRDTIGKIKTTIKTIGDES